MDKIKVEHMSKRFKQHVLFQDFTYHFEENKFYAITGESGAGKSTLLHMIGGLEPIDEGDILYDSEYSIKHNSNHRALWKNKVAFIFQNYALIDTESVRQNLEMVLEIQKEKQKAEKIAEVLEKVQLSGYEDSLICTLSGGEQQRVAMARVLLKHCDVVLADEPTGNLDEKNREIIFQILKDLQSDGKTILMVTHDMALAKRCDEILQLKR